MGARRGFFPMLLLLILGGAAAMHGEPSHEVSVSSVLELWGDVLRDVDQFGLKLTRLSEHEEMQLGAELSAAALKSGKPVPALGQYVAAVGRLLEPHVRRKGIQYEFHVIDAGRTINAFALPGGRIFVTTGMLDFLRTEAELAAILGHEMSHVDLRHCVEHYQLAMAFGRVGAKPIGQVAEFVRYLAAIEYSKYQELDADTHGVRLGIEAGYDPSAGPAVFNRMRQHFRERAGTKARTPAGEVTQVLLDAPASYFRSHPPSADREQRLSAFVARNRESLAGSSLYVGVENYRQKIPRSQQEFTGERRGM